MCDVITHYCRHENNNSGKVEVVKIGHNWTKLVSAKFWEIIKNHLKRAPVGLGQGIVRKIIDKKLFQRIIKTIKT